MTCSLVVASLGPTLASESSSSSTTVFVVTRCPPCGTREPVKSSESSSVNQSNSSTRQKKNERCSERNAKHTEFEEVDSCLVTTYVEIIVEQAPALEPQLREVVPPVVSKHHAPTWLEHSVDVGDCLTPFIGVESTEDKDHNDDVDRSGLDSWR